MFDIGSPELLTVLVVAIVVVGPDRLPEVMRSTAKTWRALKSSLSRIQAQIQDEIGFDRIRQQLHEEEVLNQIKAAKIELDGLCSPSSVVPNITGNGIGLTELATAPSPDPTHWPGMPPPDAR